MANFTEAQQKYIGDTITLAIAQMESKVGSILGQGEAMQTRIQSIVQAHDTALQERSGLRIGRAGECSQCEVGRIQRDDQRHRREAQER